MLRTVNGTDILEYTFTLAARQLSDFSDRCVFFESSKESRFIKNSICSLEKRDGRVSLTETRLLQSERGVQTRTKIQSKKEFERYLQSIFDIESENITIAPLASSIIVPS